MENRAYALITGCFVIAVLVALALWANWLAGEPRKRTAYRVVSTTPVSGLNPQGTVRYRGIPVGRVTTIALDPADARRVLVGIEVDPVVPVTRGTYAQLGQEGITGIAYVHLLDDGTDAGAPALRGGVGEIPLRPSFLDQIGDSARDLAREAQVALTGVNAVLAPENRERFAAALASTQQLLVRLDETARRLGPLVARAEERLEAWGGEDTRRPLRESLASMAEASRELPALVQEARQAIGDTRALTADLRRLSAESQAAAGALREDMLPRVNTLAETVERGAGRVGRLALELERRPESLLWGRPLSRPGPGEPGYREP